MAPCPAHAQRAKVDAQVVAPNEQDMAYSISPQGAHLVAFTQKGTRWVVLHDGVPGPLFDQIISSGGGGRISFSPDGTRFGYAGRQGQEWVIVIDGKEALRRPIGSNETLLRGAGIGIGFTPNSRHWFFHYNNPNEGNPLADPPRLIWDGVSGPVGAENDIVVSADGEHYAYTVTNPANPNQKVLIVDGKPAPTLGFTPVFTGDGLHLYTQKITIPRVGPQVTELLLDGRPIVRAFKTEVFTAPVGSLAVIKVSRPDGVTFLHTGGVKVPESDGQYISPIQFSADGKHWAAKYGLPGVPNYLIVDGVKQREYEAVDSLLWTDTGTPVYTVGAGAKTFVITGDQESDGYPRSSFPIALGKGGRVGYVASLNGATVVVVDGKVTPPPARMWSDEFRFSPDGLRTAYAVTAPGATSGTVMVDHKPQASSTSVAFGQVQKGLAVQYIWSPDSKTTMHYGYPGTQYTGQFALFVGNRSVAHGTTPRIELPTFTPDAKHLFWLAMAPNNEDMQVFLDGNVVFEFDGQGRGPLTDKGNWEMGADGVLTFIVQTFEGFKRVRVTPGPENGIEAMLAKGKVGRE
ncbi:MAG: hypothetical protein SFU57_03315 [Gemmatimonadales bacterium]|nr:hypothetical protein [Gemmatimonadales bacterium]